MNSIPANPILVEKYRNSTLESFHRGSICILNSEGDIKFTAGNPNQMVFPRSALKFIQQVPLIEDGVHDHFNLSEEEIAITCGSHNGEQYHCNLVRSILHKIGLQEENLHCGAQPPTLKNDRHQLIKNDQKPLPIHNNCSGKHAGFLAQSLFHGFSTNDYIAKDHALQQKIKELVAELHELPASEMDTGLDGCSAPIFSMPLFNMTLGFKNFLFPENISDPSRKEACKVLHRIARDNPYLIAGTNRYCTDIMKASGGRVIAKTGADGIFILGCPEQRWIAGVKIDDGLMGPQYAVAQAIINQADLLTKEQKQEIDQYQERALKTWSGANCGLLKFNGDILADLNLD